MEVPGWKYISYMFDFKEDEVHVIKTLYVYCNEAYTSDFVTSVWCIYSMKMENILLNHKHCVVMYIYYVFIYESSERLCVGVYRFVCVYIFVCW